MGRFVPGEYNFIPVHLEWLIHISLLPVQHGAGVAYAVVQCNQPLLFLLHLMQSFAKKQNTLLPFRSRVFHLIGQNLTWQL